MIIPHKRFQSGLDPPTYGLWCIPKFAGVFDAQTNVSFHFTHHNFFIPSGGPSKLELMTLVNPDIVSKSPHILASIHANNDMNMGE